MNTERNIDDKAIEMSQFELGQLGDGEVAYIKLLEPGEADGLFPGIDGIPDGINLYALTGADGTPLALTDSHSAAMAHAAEGELDVASVH